MNFFQTSRKDDILALFFILMRLLNNDLPIGKEKDVLPLT